jgi:fibronectin-binding autotransporter adhesin
VDDCHGFWVAATGGEVEMGADPGFEFSGDSVGLFTGVDALLSETESGRGLRGGLVLGYQQGNYWTTGVNSTLLAGLNEANVRVKAPTGGMYASTTWRSGAHLDVSLTAQVPRATIQTRDGFSHSINGSSLALSARLAYPYRVGSDGWVLEPQLQLSAVASDWRETTDDSGKQLSINEGGYGIARAALRVEKTFATAKGGTVRPWMTLGVQNTVGDNDEALDITLPGAAAEVEAFPAHDAATSASLDLGIEARLSNGVSLFGVGSYGHSLSGTDEETRAVNIGVRMRW